MTAHGRLRWLSRCLFCAVLGFLSSACGEEDLPPSEAPPSIVVQLQPRIAEIEPVRANIALLAKELQVEVAFSNTPETAGPYDLTITALPPAYTHVTVPTSYWGLFAGFWDERDEVDLATLLSDARQTLYVPREYQPELEYILGAPAASLTWLWLDEVADAVIAHPGSLGMLRTSRPDPRLRSLTVNGVDTVRAEGDGERSLLVKRLYVGWQDESLADFGHAVADRLWAAPPTAVRIVFTGDIIPARCVYDRHRRANDYTSAFQGTAEYLRAANITVASLDGTISDAAEPIACEETFSLLAPSRSVEGFTFAGFDVISVATNHAKDCGKTGFCGDRPLLDTLSKLRGAGIQPVGGGEDLAHAHQPVILTAKDIRFAFLAYDDISSRAFGAGETTPGTAALSAEALRRDIAAAQRQADVVIVLPHWGIEYTPTPTQRQRDLAAVAVEAGATLVIGNHPHAVQAVAWRGGSFVAYSLGNFVFDQDWSLETQQGVVLEATFFGSRLVALRFHPVRIVDMHRPTWATGREAASILHRMRAATDALR